jgi:hypothetical protein
MGFHGGYTIYNVTVSPKQYYRALSFPLFEARDYNKSGSLVYIKIRNAFWGYTYSYFVYLFTPVHKKRVD